LRERWVRRRERGREEGKYLESSARYTSERPRTEGEMGERDRGEMGVRYGD